MHRGLNSDGGGDCAGLPAARRAPMRARHTLLSRAAHYAVEQLEGRTLLSTVTTDAADYAFGSVAHIVGTEFLPGEHVQLQVKHVDAGGSNADPQNQPWQVQADAAGGFAATWVVDDPDAVGASYVLSATGSESTLRAEARFTDSLATPGNFVAKAVSLTSVRLSWTEVSGANAYYIYRGDYGAAFLTGIATVSASGAGTLATYIDSGLLLHHSYQYSIKAVDKGGEASNSAYSFTQTFNSNVTLHADRPTVTVNEGDTATNSGTWSEADGDVVQLSAYLGAISKSGAGPNGTWSWSTKTDGSNGQQRVSVFGYDRWQDEGYYGPYTAYGTYANLSFDLVVRNVAPVAVPDARSTYSNTPTTFPAASLTANDRDVDPVLLVTAVGAAAHGTVQFKDGNITYSPATGYEGPDTFSYTVADLDGGVSTGVVNVSVESPILVSSGEGGGGTVAQGGRLIYNPTSFVVGFASSLSTSGSTTGVNSVTNPANWRLTRNGTELLGRISSIKFALNAAAGRYDATVTFSIALSAGAYVLTARDTIRDSAGRALDGNNDGVPGGDFNRAFVVDPPTQAGLEFTVNPTATSRREHISVASDDAGNTVMVWLAAGQRTGSYSVYAQRYNAAGVAQGTEIFVADSTQAAPAVAVDADGDFVVTWTEQSLTTGKDVMARRYSAAGVAQGGKLQVNTITVGEQYEPAVAMDAAGNFIVTWTGYDIVGAFDSNFNPLPDSVGVRARRFTAAGAAQQVPGAASGVTEFIVNDVVTRGDQRESAVAADDAGNFVVTWTGYDGINPSNPNEGAFVGVHARRYGAAGAAQGSEFLVNATTAGIQRDPTVAMAGDGRFVIAWESDNQAGYLFSIYSRRFDKTGGARGGEVRLTDEAGMQPEPAVAVAGNGAFAVAWRGLGESTDSGGHPVYTPELWTGRFDDSGVRQGTALRVNAAAGAAGDELNPSAAMDVAGDLVIAWTRADETAGTSAVYAARFDPTGSARGTEFRVNTRTAGARSGVSVASNAAGDWVAVWESFGQDGSGSGVYAQRYTAAGVAQGPEFRVNDFTEGAQYGAAVAMDATGEFVITWTGLYYAPDGFSADSLSTGTTEVYAKRFSATGVPQQVPGGRAGLTEFQVNVNSKGNQLHPSVAMDDNGGFVIVWLDDSPQNSGVQGRRFNAAGVSQQAPGAAAGVSEFLIRANANSIDFGSPAVAADAAGNFVVVYATTAINPVTPTQLIGRVMARQYSAAGAVVGGEITVTGDLRTVREVSPAVAVDADGDFVVAWTRSAQQLVGGATAGAYTRRFDKTGVARGLEVLVGNGATQSLAVDDDGDFVVILQGDNLDTSGRTKSGVFAQRYSSGGTLQGALISVYVSPSTVFVPTFWPRVAMDADGDFVAAWTSPVVGGFDDSMSQISGKLFLSSAPTPRAGSPYTVLEGGSVTLNASGSTDPNSDPLAYSWDVNGDGFFGDATGVNPTLNWSSLQALGITDGPSAVENVRVRVDDGKTYPVTSAATSIAVRNAAPSPAVGGETQAVRGRPLQISLNATDPSTADASAGFSFSVDWGDGSPARAVSSAELVTQNLLDHTYTEAGAYDIRVVATDRDGTVSAPTIRTVDVHAAMLDGGVLYGGGTSGDDQVEIAKGSVILRIAGEVVAWYREEDVQRVIIYAQGGDDIVETEPAVTTAVTLYGGDGNDRLVGGSGADIIFGGEGEDTILGGAGDDNLQGQGGNDNIGGDDGADQLHGGAGTNVLAGGSGGDTLNLGSVGSRTAPEGSVVQMSAVIPGAISALVDWGDGSPAQSATVDVGSSTVSAAHTYLAEGNYVARINIVGGENGAADVSMATFEVAVTDGTSPTADLVDVSPDPRDSAIDSVDVKFSEKIDPTSFDWRDLTLTRDGGSNLLSASITITRVTDTLYRVGGLQTLTGESGTYQLSLNNAGIRDQAGNAGSGAASESWVVIVGMPTANAGASYSIVEGQALSLDASGSSDPQGDVLTYAWDVDGDGQFDDAEGVTPVLSWARLVSLGLGDGVEPVPSRQVSVQVADPAGNASVSSAILSVRNAAPTAVFLPATVSVNEGAAGPSVSFVNVSDGSYADMAAGLTFSYDFGNDGTFDSSGTGPDFSHASVPSPLLADGMGAVATPTVVTIRGRVTDKDGGFTDYFSTITVKNVAPLVNAGPDSIGSAYAATGSFADVAGDVTSATAVTVDYGDKSSTAVQRPAWNSVDRTFVLSHMYAAAGTYTVTVKVTDKDGLTGTDTAVVTVLNAPTPQATLLTPPGITPGSNTPAMFTVRYATPASANLDGLLNWSSIGAGDVQVVAPDGRVLGATFVSKTGTANAATIDATYQVLPYALNSAGGTAAAYWNGGHNGTYVVRLVGKQVADAAAKPTYAAPATVGTFPVNLVSVVLDATGSLIVAGSLGNDNLAVTVNAAAAGTYSLSLNDQTFTGTGAAAKVLLYGLGGNDTITYGYGVGATAIPSVLDGGGGDDRITGGAGVETLVGGDGSDWLAGGAGNDIYAFGIVAAGAETDTLDETEGGGTADALSFAKVAATDGVNVDLASGTTALGRHLNRTLLTASVGGGGQFENVTGGAGDDVLAGNALANALAGGAGHNVLLGREGNDKLTGGIGNDRLDGGAGNDALTGGDGDDFLAGGLGDDTYTFGAVATTSSAQVDTVIETEGTAGGTDALSFSGLKDVDGVTVDLAGTLPELAKHQGRTVRLATGSSAADFENVTGGAGSDLLIGNAAANVLTGNAGDDTIRGSDGKDTLSGGVGNDLLDGGDGDDSLAGGDGNDTLDGGEGTDKLTGGKGDDVYRFADAFITQTDTVVELVAEGTDLLDFGSVNAGLTVNLRGTLTTQPLATQTSRTVKIAAAGQAANFENVTGGSGADLIYGNAAVNLIRGGGGNDQLFSRDLVADILDGGDGLDVAEVDANDVYQAVEDVRKL